MAALKKDVILNLQITDKEAVGNIAALTKRLDELKVKRLGLNAAVKTGTINEDEYYKKIAALDAEIREVNSSVKAYQKELSNSVQAQRQADGSIEQMRAQLKNMRSEYEALSAADRDNPLVGGKQLEAIQTTTAELKKLEGAQGDFRRTVGDYASAFDASSESITRFGSILGGVFGGNGVVGKAATVVTGFGRALQDIGKQTKDSITPLTDSLKGVGEGAQVMENAGQTISNAGEQAENASKTVQGFGKALYEAGGEAKTAEQGVSAASKGIGGLKGSIQAGLGALKSFGTQLLALMKIPIVAVFTAISLAVIKLVDAFKKNDNATTALASALSALKPILDVVERAFSAIVDVLAKVVEGISSVIRGITGLIPGLRDYAKAEEDIVRAADNLEESQRQYTANHAKRENEIAKLRDKSLQKDRYTFAERRKFLQQAMDIEKADLKEKTANAKEELRVAERKAALEMGYSKLTQDVYNKMSDEQKNRITALRAAVKDAETEYYTSTRRMQSQMQGFISQEKADAEAAKKEAEQRAKEAAQRAKERRKNELTELRALEDAYTGSIANMHDREYAQAVNEGNRRIEDLKRRLSEEENLTKAAKEAINRQIVLAEADLQIRLGEIRKKYSEEQLKKQADEAKAYYQRVLANLTDEDAKVRIQIKLGRLETEQLKRGLQQQVDEYSRVAQAAMDDVNARLSESEIKVKYGVVFDERGIDTSKGYFEALRTLQAVYQREYEEAQQLFADNVVQIDKAQANSEVKIREDANNRAEALRQKYEDIMNAISLEGDLEQYRYNELEKSRIMEEQAQRRLDIAQKEAERIKDYNETAAIAVYGSIEAWNNAVAESDLKVIEAQNAVAQAIRNTTAVQQAQRKKMVDAALSIAEAVGSVAGSMQGLFEAMAEKNEKYQDWATAMAMVQIMVSTAISIANAIQGATAAAAATGPGAPIATPIFIAEMVAIVAGAIASATSTLMKAKEQKKGAPKFAEGGLIGGRTARTTAEGTRDDVPIMASVGEYVMPAEQTRKYRRLLDIMRGSGAANITNTYAAGGIVTRTIISNSTNELNMEAVGELFAEAVENITPVVSVREITSAQRRVKAKEDVSRR